MRSGRTSYASSPAGSARALKQKPRPRISKRVWNQRMLLIFFVILPVLGALAIFLQPMRWVFMVCALLAIALMWMLRAFLPPGRLILSAAYGLMVVFTLVTALGASPSSQRRTPSFAPTGAPIVTAEPTPQFSVSTMGTNVPADFYATPEPYANPDADYTGGDAETEIETLPAQADNGAYVSMYKSDAEIALENFMERWRRGIIADMVEYTAPSWRVAQQDTSSLNGAQQQLFWKFGQKPLVDWRQMSAPSGTEASGSRTITIQADINYGSEERTYEYEAITLYEEGGWYVDPNSLSSGILKEQATPTPDPNITPTPTPEPTPTPTPGPKTKLYYNKDGGKRYHIDEGCSSVDKKYLPMASFNYSELGKHPALVPCPVCGAPDRP